MKRLYVRTFWLFSILLSLFSGPLLAQIEDKDQQGAQKIMGLEFDQAERDSMRQGLESQLRSYEALREVSLPNSVSPAIGFQPVPPGFPSPTTQRTIHWPETKPVSLPENREQLAFYTVSQLAYLIQTQQITSLELTHLYLNRLKTYGDTLECVIRILEEEALAQAKKADQEIASGKYRGPLHGIPYGVKDLLAVEGHPTTWGAEPYKDQIIEETATVVKKLNEAGAVLIAKLTMGALAWGDVWYGGTTRNPWNLTQGSSGSSAGSASATSAGLVGFSIGTETLGSIVSPSTRCGVSGLRPTYGRVSRTGAMALSWSLDKIGPICRSINDCALVFDVIRGKDGKDMSLIDYPFNYDAGKELSNFKIGYFKEAFDQDYSGKSNDLAVLEAMKKAGAELVPVSFPKEIPAWALRIILSAEAAAAFDELTRTNRDTQLVRQIRNAWPNVFRTARFIPAVEYIQANRVRQLLLEEMNQIMADFDVVITPSYGGNQLTITNLTGHPCAVVPNGLNDQGSPTSISFIGNLFDEASITRVADIYQNLTDFDEMYPPLFYPGKQFTSIQSVEEELIMGGDEDTPMRVFLITNPDDSLLLRTQSKSVKADPNDPVLQHFIKRLLRTVQDSASMGVGIAAPQVGLLRQIVYVQRFDKEGFPFEAYLNPQILQYSKLKRVGPEGCLSIPDVRDSVSRSYSILIEYDYPDGSHHIEMIEDFTAVIFQHEIDHLNGILFPDHLKQEIRDAKGRKEGDD
ncbi:MAG: peptide deformylase [Bacteroidetes bacterium]|nr:peptide deformylase [Bacteroidota bacterium]